jgi:hypothetical protein
MISVRLLFSILVATMLLGLTGCDENRYCTKSPDCTEHGKCKKGEGASGCVAASDADCKASDGCKQKGKCTAKDGKCSALTDADCKDSQLCSVSKFCQSFDGGCVDFDRHFDPRCTKECRKDGHCVRKGDKCIAMSQKHCWGTPTDKPAEESICYLVGRCTLANETCIVGSAADCAQTKGCKKEAKCALADGKCQATVEECGKHLLCTNSGQCSVKDGACVAGGNADCKKSAYCTKHGQCSEDKGACIAATDADCKGSTQCKEVNSCRADKGQCTK